MRRLIITGAVAIAASIPATAQAAPVTVANNNDSGPGSLRAAVAAANAGDTVVIPASVGPITLTSGEIAVTKDLTIQGAGAATTVVSGNTHSRVFCIRAPACPAASTGTQPSVTFADLEITLGRVTTGANADGGAGIYNEGGNLSLQRVTMDANSVAFGANEADGGGAIFNNRGTVTIADSRIGPDNSVTGGPDARGLLGGGGVLSFGDTTVTNSSVEGNSVAIQGSAATTFSGGGGIRVPVGRLELDGSAVTGNQAAITSTNGQANGGGGVLADGRTGFSVTSSHIDGNKATVSDTGRVIGGGGGGILAQDGPVSLTSSTVERNTANLTVGANSTSAGGGGARISANVTADGDTFANNSLGLNAGPGSQHDGGGGLFVQSATKTFLNTTVAQNSLAIGGASGNSGGGALYNGGDATFTHTTIAGNTSSAGIDAVASDSGTVTFANTLIARDPNAGGADCAKIGATTFVNAGHNLNDSGLCGVDPGGQTPDLKLGSLGPNGGPTDTIPLLPGSPAIDSADDRLCPSSDQRGIARPQGGACDVGAFELVPAPPVGSTPPPPAPPADPPPPARLFDGARLARRSLVVRGRVVRVPVSYPVRCSGRITLSAHGRLGSAKFSAAAGHTALVRMKLSKRARRLLARRRRVRAVASVTATANGVTKSAKSHLTLKLRRR